MSAEYLADMKKRFDKLVKPDHIKYDWDGGHCHLSIIFPQAREFMLAGLTPDELRDWSEYVQDFIDKNARPYCVPALLQQFQQLKADEYVNEPGFLFYSKPSCSHADRDNFSSLEEYIKYLEGFVGSMRYRSVLEPDEVSRYQLHALEEWISDQKALLKFDSMFEVK